VKRSNPLLGLRFRYAITDPERTNRLTNPFALLFNPVVLVPMLAGFALVCWWVFFEKGLASATYQAFNHPGLLLLVFVVTVLSAGFHEFGHAAAARYGGATPGVMGAGVYLVWPAFYTDVTDSYRLGRGGRVRTDLGGLYFNAIVAVAITGVWWLTSYDALLLVVATQILQMVRQLTPLVRFDGYHVLADVTGVPDLFHRIKPTLLGALPWRWGDPEARLLKPWARAVVTLWVVVVVPVLAVTIGMLVLAFPRVVGTAWAKLEAEQDLLATAWSDVDLVQVAARVLVMAAVAMPILGMVYVLVRMARRAAVSVWRSTADRPVRRTVAAVLAAAMVGGLAYAWWPDDDRYRPIQPYERGTLVDAVSAVPVVGRTVTGRTLAVGSTGTAQVMWDSTAPLPTRDAPQLALVLVPREGSGGSGSSDADAPTWVFPFDKPLAPGPGDNQALAVNTTDGTVVYDTAFALVWVEDGEPATNTNSAFAFASCKSCAAVAIGFQVVFVVGDNHVAVPQNLAGALTSDCVNCLTYALAKQLFITLDGPLSDDAMAELDRLWTQIATYGTSISAGKVPLDEIAEQLDAYEQQIMAIIAADQPGTIPSSPLSSSAAASASTSASPSASPSSYPPATTSGGAVASPSPTTSASTSTSSSPSPSPSSNTSSTAAPSPSTSASPSAESPSSSPSPADSTLVSSSPSG
jgi:putative peptide zinc metalloprotease protein